MSSEKIRHLKAMGAHIVITRSDVEKGIRNITRICKAAVHGNPGAYYIDQFNNPPTPGAHETSTGPEIWEQMDKRVDAIVVGVGPAAPSGLDEIFCKSKPAG